MIKTIIKRITIYFLIPFFGLFSLNSFAQNGKLKKVVLDAGHGGKDPGNLGTGRYEETEKDIVLSVTLKLGKYIEENLTDVEVIYTRNSDTYPTLWERANLANEENADLFISIHCDAFNKSSAHGSGSYIMGLDYTDENLRVAQKENSTIYLEDNYKQDYGDFDPQSIESIIALTLNQSVYMENSILIAQKIQAQFKNRVKRRDRGVRQAPFLVTSRTLMPSVLVELGFLTNPAEEDFLRSDVNQNYMASAIYRAIKEYKSEIEKNILVKKNDQSNLEDIKINSLLNKNINKDIIFRVQIGTSRLLEDKGFVGDYLIESYKEGSMYKYTIGDLNSLIKAKEVQMFAQKNGYKDSFIIAFWKGEKISISQAIEKQKTEINE